MGAVAPRRRSDRLAPAALLHDGAKGAELTLVGISDPQAQGGGNAVTAVPSRLNGDAIVPAPPPGFDGAAAIDSQGRLFGMVELKDGALANTAAAAAPASATVVPVETLRKFLAAQSVTRPRPTAAEQTPPRPRWYG